MASTSPDPTPPAPLAALPLPPTPLAAAVRLATGAAVVAVTAAVVGLAVGETGPGPSGTLRVAASGLAAVAAGFAVSRRPDSAIVWLLAALTGAAASLGFPDHWDSAQLLMRVLAAVALVGAGLMAVPRVYRRTAILGLVAWQFSSLLVATTWPDSTPWITNQIGQRFYLPFMQFTYLRNAYHFYSPEPGPASHLFALFTYELDVKDEATGRPKTVSEWFTLPRRDTQWKDPLGQTYYRRLSLTENAVRTAADAGAASEDRNQARARRTEATLGTLSTGKRVPRIPHPPQTYEVEFRWYAPPQADVTRFLLPSFTRHLAVEHSSPGYKVVNVKLYRAEHRIVTPQFFVTQKLSPYHPTLYRVYFLGDYTHEGQLVDPQDPMLYWLVPVTPKPGRHDLQHPAPDQYDDYLTVHAGYEFPWSDLRP